MLGRHEQATRVLRDVYSGRLKLHGEEHERTIVAANNYVASLLALQRLEEIKSLMRKTIPVAQRVLGDSRDVTLTMRWAYARALFEDADATLEDLREAVTTLVEAERAACRVLGGTHPIAVGIGRTLRNARAMLRARETPPGSA